MNREFLIICAAILLGWTSLASAGIATLVASIDGAQANMGNGTGSTATGTATVTFDHDTNLLSWDISWTPLDGGNITVGHFHGPAAPGSDAGIQVDFLAISGPTSPSVGSTTISDLQASNLLVGQWYINIHSEGFPAGEIRGQVEFPPCSVGADTDGDDVLDENDNCCHVYDPMMVDTDNDGYGNRCDMDIDQNGIVVARDLAFMRCAYFWPAPAPPYNTEADCDKGGLTDGITVAADLQCASRQFFRAPGPSCVDFPAEMVGPECLTDHDADGIPNAVGPPNGRDNCTLIANPNQRDTDGDGFGNSCDPDLNNDWVIDQDDVDIMNLAFFSTPGSPCWNPNADINGDGVVGFADTTILASLPKPGPSALPFAASSGTQITSACITASPDPSLTDYDDDLVFGDVDNCLLVFNPDQIDSDGDDFGNACDPDLNNDCSVDSDDVDIMNLAFFTSPGDPNWNPDADLNGDLLIDIFDLGILNSYTNRGWPGPSALATCDVAPECPLRAP